MKSDLGDLAGLIGLYQRVRVVERNPDAAGASRELLEARRLHEIRINGLMVNRGYAAQENPVFDYCLRCFNGGSDGRGALDFSPRVRRFIRYANANQGGYILSANGDVPEDIGVIDGEARFEMDRTFRYLVVPVKRLRTNIEGKWEKKCFFNTKTREPGFNENRFMVSPYVFSGKRECEDDAWHGDVPGMPNGNSRVSVYIGDGRVTEFLDRGYVTNVPAKEKKVVLSVLS